MRSGSFPWRCTRSKHSLTALHILRHTIAVDQGNHVGCVYTHATAATNYQLSNFAYLVPHLCNLVRTQENCTFRHTHNYSYTPLYLDTYTYFANQCIIINVNIPKFLYEILWLIFAYEHFTRNEWKWVCNKYGSLGKKTFKNVIILRRSLEYTRAFMKSPRWEHERNGGDALTTIDGILTKIKTVQVTWSITRQWEFV